ncbi:unnamed protein product [Rhizophagus irregularis]|nr:unnamed protein product [Rhizophagus irregularis]
MEERDFARTKILTNLGSGGLPKIRKRRTKISGGLPNNGKELRFIWWVSKELKEGTKIRFPKNGKRRPRFVNLNGLVVFPGHEDW